MAKEIRYTKKLVVMLTEEQYEMVKKYTLETGDKASNLLRRLLLKHILKPQEKEV